MLKINLFTPPKFTRQPLNIRYLNGITGKQWQYASSGRSAIYLILKDLNVKQILIPAYLCSTVLEPLRRLNITPFFYDLDEQDLNPSLESIECLTSKHNIKTILVASMYGTPASLMEIEEYCNKNGIFMIDDAAQGFGAKLGGRYVGGFGDAGFFSFSPGKPTAGHMGGFFWSKEFVEVERSNHCLTHYFRWLDFYFNRYKAYDSRYGFFKVLINLFSRVLLKFTNIYSDNMCKFEDSVLGGILANNRNDSHFFRNRYHEEFVKAFEGSNQFRVVQSLRGVASYHKIVLLFIDKKKAKVFIDYMLKSNIAVLGGYQLLVDDLGDLPNVKRINHRVVELPIEDNKEKMTYLFNKVKEFNG